MIEKIYGTAGTGKTTYLINKINELLERGYAPTDIGYYTFSRKTKKDIMDRLQDEKYKGISITTQHSLSFRMLNLSKEQIITPLTIKRIFDKLGIDFDVFVEEELFDSFMTDKKEGNLILNLIKRIRADMKKVDKNTISYYSELLNVNIDPTKAYVFWNIYEEYKSKTNKYDYLDLIYLALEKELLPNVKIFILDEAQDLNKVMFEQINFFLNSGKFDYVFLAGDDDQTIYEFMGSKPTYFIKLKCDKEVILDKGYRVPREVYRYAHNIISINKNRVDKNITPINNVGYIYNIYNLFDKLHKYQNTNKKIFILARTNYGVNFIKDGLLIEGIPFKYIGGKKDIWTAQFVRLNNFVYSAKIGSKIEPDDIYTAINKLSSSQFIKWGIKTKLKQYPILEPMSFEEVKKTFFINPNVSLNTVVNNFNISEGRIEYLLNYSNRYVRDINIEIGTIHSAKGMEADEVYILDGITRTISDEIYSNVEKNEAERRVWFVALTRTKGNVFLFSDKKFKSYLVDEEYKVVL